MKSQRSEARWLICCVHAVVFTWAAVAPIELGVARAENTLLEYQFTSDTFNPTTVATNVAGSALSYVNANPNSPPFTNPPFIVPGGTLPDDPSYFVGQGDWFPTAYGYNENYYSFSVSVAPGYAMNVGAFSFAANSRQQVPFLTQVQYSTSPTFANPVSFDTNQISIPTQEVWNTFTATDAPISNGIGTYYFRLYGQLDPNGNGTISDLLNIGNIALIGTIQPSTVATPIYWDPAKTGGMGSGGSGTWLTANSWVSGTADFTWDNTLAEIANFGGTAGGTVSLGGIVSAVNGMNFTTAGYTITGSASASLTVGGTISTSADATISATITTAGAGTLTKAGSGALMIAGPASFATGTSLSVTAGTVIVATGGSITANGAVQDVAASPGNIAALTLEGSGAFSTDNVLNLADQGGNGTLNVQDTATLAAGNIVVSKGVTGTGGTGTVNQTGGSITTASVTLASGDATSVGTYNLNGGTLSIGAVNAGPGTSTFNFNGGTLQTTADSTDLFSGVTSVQVQNGGATIDTNGHNITLADALVATTGSTGGLTKDGTGMLTLNVANTIMGPIVINGGTLVAAANVPGGTFNGASEIDVNGGATLQLGNAAGQDNMLGNAGTDPPLYIRNGGIVTTFSGTAQNLGIIHLNNASMTGSATPQSPYADYTFNSTIFADGDGTTSSISAAGGVNLRNNITFNVASANSELDVSAVLGNEVGFTGAVTKAGLGLLVLSANDTYTGSTSVSAGTLKAETYALRSQTIDISSGAALEYDLGGKVFQYPTTLTGAGTLRLTGEGNLVFGGLGNVNISFSTGALIDVESGQITGSSSYGGTWTSNMASLNIASGATFDAVEAGSTGTMQIDALTGAGIFSGGYFGNTAATSTVTIGIAGGGGIFSGSLEDDVSAHLAIIKAGAGTQIFTGTNTYTGKTTVSAGKLIIGAAGALPTNAQLTIGTSSNAASVQFTPGIGENNLTLNLLDGSIFDLTNNSAMITYTGVSTYVTIYGFLASGYNSGRWDGPGIDSSIAANSNGSTTLGYSSTGTQMLIKYTWTGDANLDGIVNDADLSSISPTGTTWSTGDFNFDGKVNADDYALFMLGNAVSKGANISTTLPEPATPFIVDLGVCWILACRRGSKRLRLAFVEMKNSRSFYRQSAR